MIPIILKILSILGIFLLCLIGLLFIVILLVLFHPIFYKGKGSFYPEKKEFYFKAHWLFGLFHLEFHYPESTKILVKFICFTIYDSSLVKTAEEVEEDATGINPKEEDSMLDNMDMVFESLDANEPPSEMNEEKVMIDRKSVV